MVNQKYAVAILVLFGIVVVCCTFYLLTPSSVADDHIYMPLNNSSHHESGQSIVYFTISDSITGKPIPGMWLVCQATNGPNSGNVRVWAANNSGVIAAYCDVGVLAYRAAVGSQIYRVLPGTIEVYPGVQFVDIRLLPIGGKL